MSLKGYRKFLAFLLTLLCATGLVAFRMIGEASFVSVVSTALMGFFAANVGAAAAEKIGEKKAKEEKP